MVQGFYFVLSYIVHPDRGLSVARQNAMITYRTHSAYATKFGRKTRAGLYEVQNYLHAQGEVNFPDNFWHSHSKFEI